MAIEFIDTSKNARLGVFAEMLGVIASGIEDPKQMHTSLIGLMRRAFGVGCYAEVSTMGSDPGSYRITRVWRDDGSEAVPDQSPWQTNGVPVRQGGVISEIISRGQAVGVNQLNISENDPAFAEFGMYRSVMAVPGGYGGWENWVLVLDVKPEAYSSEDVEALMLRVNLIALTLKNLRTLSELRRAKSLIDSEVDRIAAIQRCLLPAATPEVAGMEVAAKFETFDRAGGDLYDYAKLPGGRWALGVSDASGHGPSAAVVSAMLNAILHTVAGERETRWLTQEISLVEVLKCGNEQMAARCIEQSFVTTFLCVWDPKLRTLTYARAGHPPAMLLRSGGIKLLDAVGDLPLGIFTETTYSQHIEPLEPGDVIVLYTDGMVEAVNEHGDMFTETRLAEAIQSAPNTSAQSVLEHVWDAVVQHQAGATPRDDQTLLVLRVMT